MNRLRISRTLGAAAGGLLGAAFFPAALASADSYDIVPDPGSTETVTGFYGLASPLPAIPGSIQGYQLFDVDDTSTGTTVGTFVADESSNIYLNSSGGSNQELLVTQVLHGTPGTAPGDVPSVGSVLDTVTVGGFSNVYSALTSPSGDVVSDTLVTPFGNFTLPITFDAADYSDAAPVDIGDGYAIVPDPGSTETLTGISGLPPVAVTVEGDQQFDVANPTGSVGTFDADVTNTSDILGNYSEALLVTSDISGTAGTGPGDVPPVDSVFNVFYFTGAGIYNIYSDLTSPSGDVISDTFVTPVGDFAIPIRYDASAGLPATESVGLPDGYDLVPASTGQLAGINGLPPLDVSVQGYQVYDVVNPATGNTIGNFDADVTTNSSLLGYSGETLVVTSDISGTAGTAAGDVPPVGSWFEVFHIGGLENIYSDLASPTGDVISDTLVTPIGDFTLPVTLDAAAGLAADLFLALP